MRRTWSATSSFNARVMTDCAASPTFPALTCSTISANTAEHPGSLLLVEPSKTLPWRAVCIAFVRRSRAIRAADRQHSERVSEVPLIRRSSGSARRGPTRSYFWDVCAAEAYGPPHPLRKCPGVSAVSHIQSAGRQVEPDPAHQVFVQVSGHWVRLRPSRTVTEQRANGTFMAHRD